MTNGRLSDVTFKNENKIYDLNIVRIFDKGISFTQILSKLTQQDSG